MKILALDSSAKAASVAISEDKKLLGEFFVNVGMTHSETLMPMVKNILKITNTKINDIDAFAVTNGPGSFTGLRIGIACIKGMAMPQNIPCFPISTLYALAYNLLGTHSIACAVMDARCGQVYNAIFEVDNQNIIRLTPDRAISIENLYAEIESLKKSIIFVGDGALLCYNERNKYSLNLHVSIAHENIRYQSAKSVAFAAFDDYIKTNQVVAPSELIPMYLRLPQAERQLNMKNNIWMGDLK